MILYFSATGNTRFVAHRLAASLGDEALDLLDRIKRDDCAPIHSDRPFVICAPTYVCEMPRFLSDHLRKTPLVGNSKVYFVFTSGGYSGISGILANHLMRRKGLRYMGCADLTMPRNYIANDHYPELDTPEIERRIRTAIEAVDGIADAIRRGERLKSRHVWLAEVLITLPFNPVWVRVRQGVGDFHATDKCVGCGKSWMANPPGAGRAARTACRAYRIVRCRPSSTGRLHRKRKDICLKSIGTRPGKMTTGSPARLNLCYNTL